MHIHISEAGSVTGHYSDNVRSIHSYNEVSSPSTTPLTHMLLSYTQMKHSLAIIQISSPPAPKNDKRRSYKMSNRCPGWRPFLAATSYLLKVKGSITTSFITQISNVIIVRTKLPFRCLNVSYVKKTTVHHY